MNRTINILVIIVFILFFVFVPLVPDVQISRPKLLVVELLSFILLLITLLGIVIQNKVVYRNSKFLLFILIFFCYILIKYITATDKPLAYNELKRWTLSVFLLYTVSSIEEKYYKRLMSFFITGSFLATLYGFLQYTGGFYRISVPKMERVMSMFGNPIFFAVHIINFVPIVFSLLLISKKYSSKFVLFVILLVSVVTLYYTKTRAAFIGLFASLLFLIYMLSKRKTVYIITCLVAFLLFVIFTRNIWERQQAHLLIWRDTLRMWSSLPITGIGLGNFHVRFVDYASEELRKIWPEKQCIINDAHNEYLQILAETGIIGFVLFLFPIFYLFKQVVCLGDDMNKEKRIIIYGLTSGVLAVLVQNIFSVDLRFVISNVYLFITLGFIIGYTSMLKQKQLWFKLPEIKIVTIIILCYLLGVVSYSVKFKTLSVLSILHFSLKDNSVKVKPEITSYGLLQQILTPYIASYKLKQEKDFFDERIVDAARTIEELEKLKKQYPNKAIIYEKIAWIYAKEKKFDKAVENYLIAIKLNPNSYAAYNNLGNIMFLTNNRTKAIEFYKKSIEINPQQIDARLNLGILYYYEGKLNLAAEQFNEVLKLDPVNEKAIVYLKKMRE